jgi:hypothetical protein
MAVLPRVGPPAGLPEPSQADADAWSAKVSAILEPYLAEFPQFYDATKIDTPADAQAAVVVWSAFPATLRRRAASEEARWRLADGTRANQDEYCEWSVERNPEGSVTRVTFTSEVREYFEHLAARDPERLRTLYEQLVGAEVRLEDLLGADGNYEPANRWNRVT